MAHTAKKCEAQGHTELADEQASKLSREIKQELSAHLKSLGLLGSGPASGNGKPSKDLIRSLHSNQRQDYLERGISGLSRTRVNRLLPKFAQGKDVVPERIKPELVPVQSGADSEFLFRMATMLWSVPVSPGYGRRMRFLVMDQSNGKLIGIFALMDPVFNLTVRDTWIGWTTEQRGRRLTSVMDAYVLGAVPPYNMVLGGKLVGSLIGSAEVADAFREKYADAKGIISGVRKHPSLALVTVTSALGRSSIYNRLRLPGLVEMFKVGESAGWGHFHVPKHTFVRMRRLLEMHGHRYARGYKFGSGPNWRIRSIREALKIIGMNEDLLRHGITREVYAMPLGQNWKAYLTGQTDECILLRPNASVIAGAALERWVIPRAKRQPDYESWTTSDVLAQLSPVLSHL